jgi:amino acid transporter
MLLSAVSIHSNFTYSPTQSHVIGVVVALTVIHALINSLSTAWLNRLSSIYAVFHIGILIAASISLLVLQKDKHTAKYVFTHVEPDSGWSPPGFSFLFGFLSAAWIMTNCDATAQ